MSHLKLSLLFIALSLFVSHVYSDTCTWQKCPPVNNDPGWINIHIVHHTHDDAGWLKRADDYYTGVNHNQAGGNAGVQYIISTVVDALTKNPDRKFTYCETGYMTRWLEDPTHKDVVQTIVNLAKNGQLEFAGGGWVQPDEAASHYVELLDQYTLGLRILDSYFENCSHSIIGWQLDPFGHSREHANLLAMMGYKALFFNREDYQQHDWRKSNKSIEFYWQVSDDLGSQILTHSYDGLYFPPCSLSFDYGSGICDSLGGGFIVDNPSLEGYNVDKVYNNLLGWAKSYTGITKQDHHVMVMEGGDFWHTNADNNYDNMDRIIKYAKSVEATNKVKIFYSTPQCYYQAVKNLTDSDPAYKLETQDGFDFFPYGSGQDSYWTGYFTSKPALKGLVRSTSSFLQLTRTLSSLDLSNFTLVGPQIETLERSVGLSQHHDAITGTSKAFVTHDYDFRLQGGITEGVKAINTAVTGLSQYTKSNSAVLPAQDVCRYLNESACPITTSNSQFAVTVYNGNTQTLTTVVQIPIADATYTVIDGTNNGIPAQKVPVFNNSLLANGGQLNNPDMSPYVLYLPVSVPPLGFSTYLVSKSAAHEEPQEVAKVYELAVGARTLTNGKITINFDEFGYLSSYTDTDGHTWPLRQEFLWYTGADGSNGQASGAYVFRPETASPHAVSDSNYVQLSLVNGSGVQEARQIFSPWVSQTIRLFPNREFVEFEWTVGPIPEEGNNQHNISKEIITRYTAPTLNNNGEYWTDANGRQMVQRIRNHQKYYQFSGLEPVAANYFPVNSRIFIKDSNHTLAILTDRSEAGGSIHDGQIELLIHRRDFYDDGYGVDEALNEPGKDGRGLVVRGKHWLFLTENAAAPKLHRNLAFELFHQPTVAFSTYSSLSGYINNFATNFSGLKTSLPDQINLLTVKPIDNSHIIVRLEHKYQTGEDSTVPTVDLATLFTTLKVNSAEQWNLQATEKISTLTDTKVTLKPMEIKTYILNVSKA